MLTTIFIVVLPTSAKNTSTYLPLLPHHAAYAKERVDYIFKQQPQTKETQALSAQQVKTQQCRNLLRPTQPDWQTKLSVEQSQMTIDCAVNFVMRRYGPINLSLKPKTWPKDKVNQYKKEQFERRAFNVNKKLALLSHNQKNEAKAKVMLKEISALKEELMALPEENLFALEQSYCLNTKNKRDCKTYNNVLRRHYGEYVKYVNDKRGTMPITAYYEKNCQRELKPLLSCQIQQRMVMELDRPKIEAQVDKLSNQEYFKQLTQCKSDYKKNRKASKTCIIGIMSKATIKQRQSSYEKELFSSVDLQELHAGKLKCTVASQCKAFGGAFYRLFQQTLQSEVKSTTNQWRTRYNQCKSRFDNREFTNTDHNLDCLLALNVAQYKIMIKQYPNLSFKQAKKVMRKDKEVRDKMMDLANWQTTI